MSPSFIDPPSYPPPRRGEGTLVHVRLRALILAGLGLVALGWLLYPEPVLAQCAMCRATVTQSPEGRQMSEKLNTAILVMFFAPYLVFGTVATVLFRARITPFVIRVLRFLLLPR